MPDIVDKLKDLCKKNGIELVERPHGHFQIKGPLLVNYYPFSKNQTAYVAGTKHRKTGIDHKKAVQMSLVAPKKVSGRVRRKGSYKAVKIRLFKKIKRCHWCGKPLEIESCTVEHIIPLKRGGLDNNNNRTLACADCNHGRGSNMPELKQ